MRLFEPEDQLFGPAHQHPGPWLANDELSYEPFCSFVAHAIYPFTAITLATGGHMADDTPAIDLEALDAYLMSDLSPDECMLLSDLDGFLTGIVAGPQLIPPSEWLPVLWGGEDPEFDSEQQMRTITGTITGRYKEIATIMEADPGSLAPIFDERPNGDPSVTDWAAGFLDAIKLRRMAWEPLFAHRRAKLLVEPLIILGDDDAFFGRPTSELEQRFYASRPKVLATCAAGIYDFWKDWQSRQRPNPRRQRGRR